MTELYKWFLDLPYKFAAIGELLGQPITDFEGNVLQIGGVDITMLGILSVSIITGIIIWRIADLLIPV